jgi:hypothetical protein
MTMLREHKDYVEYHSNNSGGFWWLEDKDWKALEAAGWEVEWYAEQNNKLFGGGDRRLGALASTAIKPGATSLREAADEWERITGQNSTDCGCACCGQPHDFTLYKDGKYIESGPTVSYGAGWR